MRAAPLADTRHPTPDTLPDAVRLFVDRARLVRPDFALTAENAGAVADICRRLDGLPLAIELASARVRVLSPEQMVARLSDRFRLVAGAAGAIPRHQTLGALLDWSYNLLAEPEQAMLRRLSVFRGGCTLEAVEQVCSGDGIAEDDALELLASLIEKSLVVPDFLHDQTRYRLLESVREYAGHKLDAGDDGAAARHRHADWYLAVARSLEAGTGDSPHQQNLEAAARVVEEFDNLRTAFEWSLGGGQRPTTALGLVNALWWFWPYHTLLPEGKQWYQRALAAVGTAAPEARASAMLHLALLAFHTEDYRAGVAYAQHAIDGGRKRGLPVLMARALRVLALNTASLGDYAEARVQLEEGVALTRATGNRRWICHLLDTLGYVLIYLGKADTARPILLEALAMAEAERVEIIEASSHMYLAFCDRREGNTRDALAHHLAAFEAATRIHHRIGAALVIAAIAPAVAADGRPLEAAQLLGIWQAQSARLGITPPPANRAELKAALDGIRAGVGDAACEAALRAGRAMTAADVPAFVRMAATPGGSEPALGSMAGPPLE